jgi:hypothetical protein
VEGGLGLASGAAITLTGLTASNLAVMSVSEGATVGTTGNNNTLTFGNDGELAITPAPDDLLVQGILNTSSSSSILALTGGVGANGRIPLVNFTDGIIMGSNSAANGGFGSVTGLPTGYHLEMTGNATTAGEIDIVQREIIDAISATPQSSQVFSGTADPISFTVQNSAYSGGDSLNFTTTNGSNVTGLATGSVAANSTSGAISGLSFSSATAGANQNGSFTLSDHNSASSGQTGSVTVGVFDHALVPNQILTPQVTQGQTVNFNYSLSNPVSGSAQRDGATVAAVSPDSGGYTSGYSGATTITEGQSSQTYTGSFTSTFGAPTSQTYDFAYGDQHNYLGYNNDNQTAMLTIDPQVNALVEVVGSNSNALADGRPLI